MGITLTFLLSLSLAAYCTSSPTAQANAASDITSSNLLVRLSSGNFVGEELAANGTDSWLGIPFAQPPVGKLRFKAPVPISHPSGTLQNATSFGNACPQEPSGSLGASQSEDCLFLNVWRPVNTTARDKLPVLVWFYVSYPVVTVRMCAYRIPPGWSVHEWVSFQLSLTAFIILLDVQSSF